MKTSTKTLVTTLRVLAVEIQSPDGIANAAIAEAAERLDEQTAEIRRLKTAIREVIEDNLHLADGEVCTLIKLKQALN